MSFDPRDVTEAPHTDALDVLDLADAPMPWPQRPAAASAFIERFDAASEKERPALFAEAEKAIAPDIVQWDQVLRALRSGWPEFKIPSRWDDWNLGDEMDKWGPTKLADATWPDA